MINRYELFSGSIACIYHDIQKIERVEMMQFGLKGPHAQCLLSLSQNPEGLSAAKLCILCERDKAAISRTLNELEQEGMICRTGAKYRANLTLTEKGREAALGVREKVELAVAQAGAGLSDEEREVFYRVLGRIAGNLHAICTDGLKEREEA